MALWVRVECDGREHFGQLQHGEITLYGGSLSSSPVPIGKTILFETAPANAGFSRYNHWPVEQLPRTRDEARLCHSGRAAVLD